MNRQPPETYPRRTIENIATFGSAFLISQVIEYVGDQIHDPQVVDVPHGTAIVIGLAVAAVVTGVIDRELHR